MQEKLFVLRVSNRITQKQMAKEIGISTKQYSFKEKGISKFNVDEMFKIADYFNLSLEDIFVPSTHQFGEKKKGDE